MRTFAVDFDDFCDATLDTLTYVAVLKERYPSLLCTLFAIPMRCSPATIVAAKALNDGADATWLQLAPHGWRHTRGECLAWTAEETVDKLAKARDMGIDAPLFRAPAWLIDAPIYEACKQAGYIVADHRVYHIYTPGCKVYRYNDKDYRRLKIRTIHGHLTPVAGNFIGDMTRDGRLNLPFDTQFISLIDAAVELA